MNKLRIRLLAVKYYLYKWFGNSYKASVCGHETKLFSRVSIFGEDYFVKAHKNSEYCPECLAKMSVKCAWCGETINVGDPITLYSPKKQDFKIPEHAVVYKEEPLQLVGCLAFGCALSGGDRSGFWVQPGKVYRVASPVEMAFLSKGIVVVHDLSDITQATPVKG
jgi:hypothetical protein